MPEFFFQRYVNGERMADDVLITKQATLEDAIPAALRLCRNSPKSVLVYVPEDSARLRDEITRLRADLAAVTAERDALAARLAPVEAIENDKYDPTREYIPLPGGWEIQTKGKGSSYRLLDKKTGERHMILAGDEPFVQEFVTRMAKEINAAAAIKSGK